MTVEFALVFPILVAILFGFIDAGRFIASRVMLAQAAAAGARAACLNSTTGTAQVQQALSDAATMLGGITLVTVDCIPAGAACTAWPKVPGLTVAVTARYNFTAGFFTTFQKAMTNISRVVC